MMFYRSGSPRMTDIEAFSIAYRKRLDEAELSGSIPENISLEVYLSLVLYADPPILALFGFTAIASEVGISRHVAFCLATYISHADELNMCSICRLGHM